MFVLHGILTRFESGEEANVDDFTELERHLFNRMINYFIRAEQTELEELKSPGGNPKYIPQVENNLEAFKSIKAKVESMFFK